MYVFVWPRQSKKRKTVACCFSVGVKNVLVCDKIRSMILDTQMYWHISLPW